MHKTRYSLLIKCATCPLCWTLNVRVWHLCSEVLRHFTGLRCVATKRLPAHSSRQRQMSKLGQRWLLILAASSLVRFVCYKQCIAWHIACWLRVYAYDDTCCLKRCWHRMVQQHSSGQQCQARSKLPRHSWFPCSADLLTWLSSKTRFLHHTCCHRISEIVASNWT